MFLFFLFFFAFLLGVGYVLVNRGSEHNSDSSVLVGKVISDIGKYGLGCIIVCVVLVLFLMAGLYMVINS